MKPGKLVVFEGISGTGKETQASLLKNFLAKSGISAIIVYHPSPELKEILATWRKKRHIDHVSEAYFLLADRYNRVQKVIAPALAKGQWVISLRNYVSALVYQAKSQSERGYLLKEFGWFEPKPDYLFWFDITPQKALARITKRYKETGESLGKFETNRLLKEKRENYRLVFKQISHIALPAGDSIAALHQKIISAIVVS